MNLSVGLMHFGWLSRYFKSRARVLISSMSAILSLAYTGHAMRKWCVVSSLSHLGHFGVGELLILLRCLFSGAWPVRSWNMSELWRLGCLAVRVAKCLDGTEASILQRRSYREDFFMTVMASFFTLALNCCLAAALLRGSGMGVFCSLSDEGSRLISDVSFLAARFACASAASFPGMPQCPGDHHMVSFRRSKSGMKILKSL